MTPDDEPAFAPVTCVAQVDLAQLEEALAGYGFAVIGLDGKLVRDKATLLAQAEADLPPVEGMRPGNWDALADYLGNGLAELGEERVALVWTDADQIVQGDLQDLLDGLRVLTGVADAVRAGEGLPHPIDLMIFLVGDGPGFRRFAG
jgi:hypothetical protein